MSNTKENVKVVDEVKNTVDKIQKLSEARRLVVEKEAAVETHEKDLQALGVVKGEKSTEYLTKKEILETAIKEVEEAKKQVESLSFKKSELKPILDVAAQRFEKELRTEQEREFHLEIGPAMNPIVSEDGEETGEFEIDKTKQNVGRKAYKTLMDYLNKDINWTAKTAPGLMVLVRNMDENKFWVRSQDFNNVITLRSSNILVLWRSIIEEMSGKGYYEARAFLECWANVGKSLSDAVRDIQKLHEGTRELGTFLNTIEDEFERSEDDLPEEPDAPVPTKEEVAPEV